jgi:hypothetical protein
MTPEQFTYWLQGFSEVSGEEAPDARQWKIIQDHLALVFKKETPTRTVEGAHGPITIPYTGWPITGNNEMKLC